MKKSSLTLVFMLTLFGLCQNANAQGKDSGSKDGFIRRTIHNIFNPKITYDTSYISRPWGNWTISADEKTAQHVVVQLKNNKNNYVKNDPSFTTSLNVAYKGVEVGYSANFDKLSKRRKDQDLTVNLNDNRYGLTFRMFTIVDLRDSYGLFDVLNDGQLKGFGAYAYYVFNNKKYSNPAAFSNSQVQKKSAGSFQISLSYYNGGLSMGISEDDYKNYIMKIINETIISELPFLIPRTYKNIPSEWKTQYLSFGFGYSYNWVPAKRWLLHISAEPSVLVWQKSITYLDNITLYKHINSDVEIELDRDEFKAPYNLFNFGFTGNLSATYSWKRGFASLLYNVTMVKIDFSHEEESIFFSSNDFIYHWWNAKIAVGFRF